jgi:hypothetical protein
MSDQFVAETASYTNIQETNIHTLRGIRTRDPNNQAAADLRFRRSCDRDGHQLIHWATTFVSVHSYTHITDLLLVEGYVTIVLCANCYLYVCVDFVKFIARV